MRSLDRAFELAERAASHDWAGDPRVPAVLLAMIHDAGGVLPVQLDRVAGHFETCDMTTIVHVYPAETCDDGDGCRLTRLYAVVHCPHENGSVEHTEFGDLARLLEFIEDRQWPIGPRLTGADPEPAPDSTVMGEGGRIWVRFADMLEDGAAWEAFDEGAEGLRTWRQVTAKCPVRLAR